MELCFQLPWIRSCRWAWYLLNYIRRPLQSWIQVTCQAHKLCGKTKAEFTSEGCYSTCPTDTPVPSITIHHILHGHSVFHLWGPHSVWRVCFLQRGKVGREATIPFQRLVSRKRRTWILFEELRLNFFFSPRKDHPKSARIVSDCPSELKKWSS